MFRAGMWGLAALVTVAALSGCANKGRLAPVDDHSISGARGGAIRVWPGAENADKIGYYTVKPGDTLIRIGMDNGQSWRDIIRWNKLDNPNLIETGQVLRVAPPPSDVAVAAPRPVASQPSVMPAKPVEPALAAPAAADDALNFQWPVLGNLIAGFDESKNKGLDIAGKAGDPVLASADGRVVYAGAGLRGYGNLIILKHNNTYLTAYAHNQTLLVKEDQIIKRGQKIAEMGNSDADQVKLHFEIRRQGKPVDPAKYLPGN
ncbi:peptidoglycan DD-metalloendopeptidase family protein [Limnohabitans sp.]|uniref:peptidoglycan DD-metalloendopeptidase family protein n=1 Tax=Limnohabitans sp. TaxID=1907725 RepID=UPI00286F397A|nr:peptidoglycan DD-metalloendopeptidase family protein [Limnohabitans sp.]